jgi:hypothetical protein
MSKQIPNEPAPRDSELNKALADGLEHTLGQIEGDIFRAVKRGDMTSAHYYREQYAITETIIYAFRNNRIAKTDEDVERLINGK